MTLRMAIALFIAVIVASDTVRADTSGPAAGTVYMCDNVCECACAPTVTVGFDGDSGELV